MSKDAIKITVRQTQFKAENITTHYTESTLMSHFLTALSMSFPQGERFFVETVRNVRDHIRDEQLQKDISGFIGQEAHHARAHEQFNQLVQSSEYHLRKFEKAYEQEMIRLRGLSKRRQLAATVALEHFTAMMAGYMLEYPDVMFKGLSENMRNLWLWHAVEEIEHKHVAFDVYQQIFANLPQRRRSMRTITVGFISSTIVMTSHLVWQDRKNTLYSPGQLFKNFQTLLGLTQMIWRLLPDYLAFYKEDFHPSKIDQQDLLINARELLGRC
ncbi:metal-dependent hydrolase [Acinetobacter haemolyticus]|uniref:Metal-dependent hydrolase n=1 Tax=Acinetobacter haemolyticus TaxID=29430 RepID=A0A4P7B2Q2_ACIHA|nr:metal-dependent hydrolase [Acinetobacter haemolyticus]QBQ15867.1 metal-dependent hydrolase [Acinetobacter haemolyticus]